MKILFFTFIFSNSFAEKEIDNYKNWYKTSTHPPTISFDKFKNLTTIHYGMPFETKEPFEMNGHKLLSPHRWNFDAYILIKGQDKKSKAIYKILITSTTTDWRYLECKDFHGLMDGKKMKYENLEYTNNVNGGESVSEFFEIDLTKKQFNSLVKCQKMEYEICDNQAILTADVLFVVWAVNKKYEEFLLKK